MLIPFWQRILSFFLYMLPWSDAIPFGSNLFLEFQWLQWISLPALPIFILQKSMPFSGILLFFLLFIGIVRNPKAPYFLRFNALQALLVDIALVVMGYAFRILIAPFGGGLMVRTLSNTIFLGVFAIVIFALIECLQGKEADLPGISQAVRIQMY